MLIHDPAIITSDVEDVIPAALARLVDDGRRRELARALHAPQPPCSPAITQQLEHMRGLLAKYRAQAIAVHARLVALELAGNDNVASLRRALIESSVRIESISQLLGESGPRLARGTEAVEPIDEWVEQPTLKRAR